MKIGSNGQKRLARLLLRPDFGAILSALLLLTVLTIIDPSGWWSVQTLSGVLQATAILGVLAIGQALVILAREIDLSVGSVFGFSAISFITLQADFGVPGAVFVALVLCALFGLLNALFVVKGKVSSMIVTLGSLFFIRGLIYVWTGGTVRALPKDAQVSSLAKIFSSEIFGFNVALIWMTFILLGFSLFVWRTRLGNRLLAVGGNIKTARSRGIKTGYVRTLAFVLCALLAGFAGILAVFDQPETHVTLGQYIELEAIAAAVIGGCLLLGGRGSLLGAVLGAFIIVSVRYQLIAIGAHSAWLITFVGLVLIVAVISNELLSRWAVRIHVNN